MRRRRFKGTFEVYKVNDNTGEWTLKRTFTKTITADSWEEATEIFKDLYCTPTIWLDDVEEV